jgi:hypothetical protein
MPAFNSIAKNPIAGYKITEQKNTTIYGVHRNKILNFFGDGDRGSTQRIHGILLHKIFFWCLNK